MFYFRKAASDPDDDAAQRQAVQQFRAKLKKEGLLCWEFLSTEQFGQLVRVHLTRHIQNWAKRHRQPPATAHPTQSDLADRFSGYVDNVKKQSIVLPSIISQFAHAHLAFLTENSRRAAQVRAMSDEQLTDEFRMLSLIEMANAMDHYADAAERFEASFISAFSSFVESVLGAAAVSIAFPDADTKPLRQALVKLRGKLHSLYGAMGEFVAPLARLKPQLNGVMATSNERTVAALARFRERVRFGELMLVESEKLFNTRRRT